MRKKRTNWNNTPWTRTETDLLMRKVGEHRKGKLVDWKTISGDAETWGILSANGKRNMHAIRCRYYNLSDNGAPKRFAPERKVRVAKAGRVARPPALPVQFCPCCGHDIRRCPKCETDLTVFMAAANIKAL